MKEARDTQQCMPANWTHLPPPEQSLLLKRDKKGTVRPIEKIPTPVDEFGIPDSDAMLEIALGTLSSDYTPPGISNVHHRIYPRDRYHNHPSGSIIPKLYRESAANMFRYQQQIHNYFHAIFEDPRETTMDVMHQWVIEQAQADQLFYIGQTAIQLSRAKYRDIESDMIRSHLRFHALKDSKQMKAIFYDFLDSYPDSQLGLMPDRTVLATEDFPEAVRMLGSLAGARSLDARRETHSLLKRVGIQAIA